MVPKGWSHTTLGQVMAFKNGLNFTKAGVGEEIKIVGVSDFKDFSELRSTEHLESVNVASHIKDDELLTDGDLLFVRSNGNKDLIGRCLFFPEVNERLSFSGFTIRGRADKKNVLPQYIAFVARSSFFKSQISQYGGGTNISNLSQQILNDIILLLPSHDEQKKIAQILSAWDKAISTTEQLLANSQQQKKALMQQLLTGKKRLLDKNGVRFSGEWKFQSISQISKRIQRKSDDEGHPILTISSLSGFVRQDERYSRYMAGESVKNYILLKKGEFAYNKGNSKTYEFGCIFDLDSYKSGLVPHVYVCFKLHQGLSHRYFKYLFEADYLKPQLGALVNTGVRNNGLLNIKPSEFMNAKVPVPCFDEQEQIADVLHASSETINKLQLKLDALKQEKKALMQQLLTGKRRVQL
ncbi:restriction endonuclease subunit S [Aeromonas veronii]|uniref:restriction endonuclease subunit S n=1 Tax=Aeromonas veronii TaxID=654 RepID=UPI0015E6B3D7|nr:restriction endonuclease subunit S [Aeromonas veronii]MBA2073971.1 type I restriction endonuclease subunit R [Aeromonas veronii]